MSQGKALSNLEIEEIQALIMRGCTEREISTLTGFARVTIRKVKHNLTRRTDMDFTIPYHIQGVKGEKYISPIDDEILYIQPSNRYYRILGGKHDRIALHVHEAKKVFELVDLAWNVEAHVHHVDGLGTNTRLDNLSVFNSGGDHTQHHSDMEHAMYSFLVLNDLLPEFYDEFPHLRCQTLEDMIVLKLKELQNK